MSDEHILVEELAVTDFVELYATDPREAENRLALLLIHEDAAVLRYAMLSCIKSAAMAAGVSEPSYRKPDHSAALTALAEVGVLSAIHKRGFTFEQLLPFVSDPELLCEAYEAVCEVPLFEEEVEEVVDVEQEVEVEERPKPNRLPSIHLVAYMRPVGASASGSRTVSVSGKAASAPAETGPDQTSPREPKSRVSFEVDAARQVRVELTGPVCKFPRLRVRITDITDPDNRAVVDAEFPVTRDPDRGVIEIPGVAQAGENLRVEVFGEDAD
jgi:hypothetical protein